MSAEEEIKAFTKEREEDKALADVLKMNNNYLNMENDLLKRFLAIWEMESKVFNSLTNIAFWVGLPTVRLTEHSDSKAVRVIGFLCAIPLSPLLVPCVIILVIAVLLDVIETI